MRELAKLVHQRRSTGRLHGFEPDLNLFGSTLLAALRGRRADRISLGHVDVPNDRGTLEEGGQDCFIEVGPMKHDLPNSAKRWQGLRGTAPRTTASLSSARR